MSCVKPPQLFGENATSAGSWCDVRAFLFVYTCGCCPLLILFICSFTVSAAFDHSPQNTVRALPLEDGATDVTLLNKLHFDDLFLSLSCRKRWGNLENTRTMKFGDEQTEKKRRIALGGCDGADGEEIASASAPSVLRRCSPGSKLGPYSFLPAVAKYCLRDDESASALALRYVGFGSWLQTSIRL